MGGLAQKIPVTFVTFAIATAAIAGIPPLAGFFSKDEILWFAFASARGGSPLLWARGRATALMTAFYMFRLLWLTFLGRSRMDAEVEHHVHESPLSMTGVLMRAGRCCRRSAASSRCRTSSSRCCRCRRCAEALHHFETPLLVAVGRDRARRPGAAPRSSSAAAPARAERAARALRRAAPRCSPASTSSTSSTSACSAGRSSGSRTASSCASATACCSTAR